MSVQIDTGTAALTGEQRLIAAMQEFVDSKTFDGKDCCACLIGQVGIALGLDPMTDDVVAIVARRFGVCEWAVHHIFQTAAEFRYRDDLEAAIQMAAEELGLAPTGKEEPYRE